jgi:hypothetical protein
MVRRDPEWLPVLDSTQPVGIVGVAIVVAVTAPDISVPRHHRGLTRARFGTLLRVYWSWSHAGLRHFGGSVRFIAQNALKKTKAAATA